uniref:Secreted protein n=1 Tax=Castor canadensis TaxID=51338 RepID=A0A8C0XJ22_CASCN
MPCPPGAAVWQVLFAVEASIARWASACEGCQVVSAGARATGIAQTLINISGTAWTSKARKARARKRAHAVLTGATIEAGVWGQKGGDHSPCSPSSVCPDPAMPCIQGNSRRNHSWVPVAHTYNPSYLGD